MQSCPTDDRWDAYLADGLSPPEEAELEAHLDGCARCVARLERLTGSGGAPTTLPAARAPVAPRAERCVGPFRLERELGRGGMGVVWLAEHPTLGRKVALKLLRADAFAGGDAAGRLRVEAETLARLDHPRVTRVYDFGADDGRPYLVMEYLPGGTLADALRAGPLGPREAAAVVAGLAGAVAAAHRLGVLHRDLKPANVLLADGDAPLAERVRVTDFGLAKRLGGEAQTVDGLVMGTPAYMSPEQARGVRDLTGAADVWSLGVVLFECLTGRTPLRGDPMDILTRLNAGETIRLPRHGQPRDLVTICHKCLEHDPARRYAGAPDLEADLGRFLDGRPIAARPAGALERGVKWARRHRAGAALLALASVVSLAGFPAMTVLYLRTQTLAAAAEAAREQAERALYVSRVSLAARALEAGRTGEARELLLGCLPGLGRPDRRNWEWGRLAALVFDRAAPARADEGRFPGVRALAARRGGGWVSGSGAPAGNLGAGVANVDQVRPGVLREWADRWAAGRVARQWAGHGGAVTGLAAAPDGSWLVSQGGDGSLFRHEPGAEPLRLANAGSHGAGFAARALPDGRRVAVVTNLGVSVRDALTGRVAWKWADAAALDARPARGGSVLIAARLWLAARLLDTETGRELPTPPWPAGSFAVAAHPARPLVAVADFDRVSEWELDSGRLVRQLSGHSQMVRCLEYLPDGRLASAGDDATVRLWDAGNGYGCWVYRRHADRVTALAASADGTALLSGDGSGVLRVHDVTRPPGWHAFSPPEPPHLGEYVAHVGFAPDSGTAVGVATTDWGGADLVALDLATNRRTPAPLDASVLPYRSGTTRARDWAVSPGRTRLAAVVPPRPGRPRPVLSVFALPGGARVSERPLDAPWPVAVLALADDGTALLNTPASGVLTAIGATGPPASRALPAPWRAGLAFPLPDGGTLALAGTQGDKLALFVLPASGGEPGPPVPLPEGSWLGGGASADGGVFALCGADGRVEAVDAATGASRWRADVSGPALEAAFSPDGSRVAVNTQLGSVRVLDAATGDTVAELDLPASTGMYGYKPMAAWSADGRRLIANAWNGECRVWEAADWRDAP